MQFSTSFIALIGATLLGQGLSVAIPAIAEGEILDDVSSLNSTELPPDVTEFLQRRGGVQLQKEGQYCFNTWETVTNDPVVQYWYVYVPHSGVKANPMWNHLNLNGCAPTEHKYYYVAETQGVVLTFHTSEACTARRVEKAYRSASTPPKNIGCTFNGKEGPDAAEGIATGAAAAFTALLELFKIGIH